MFKILELFSGTKSVGKVAEELGFDVVSLDLRNADINCDILHWDYTIFPPGTFDVIWASPPCTEYSRAKTVGVRNIEHANQIVLKTLEIISYLNPTYWVIENPQTGLLKHQYFMNDLPYNDVDYCKYGMPYRKRTRLWNNIYPNFTPLPLCKKDCNSMIGNRHISMGQHDSNSTRDLYVIPSDLILDIFYSMMPEGYHPIPH
jgi:site-specific DNA-cytosine methylase